MRGAVVVRTNGGALTDGNRDVDGRESAGGRCGSASRRNAGTGAAARAARMCDEALRCRADSCDVAAAIDARH